MYLHVPVCVLSSPNKGTCLKIYVIIDIYLVYIYVAMEKLIGLLKSAIALVGRIKWFREPRAGRSSPLFKDKS